MNHTPGICPLFRSARTFHEFPRRFRSAGVAFDAVSWERPGPSTDLRPDARSVLSPAARCGTGDPKRSSRFWRWHPATFARSLGPSRALSLVPWQIPVTTAPRKAARSAMRVALQAAKAISRSTSNDLFRC